MPNMVGSKRSFQVFYLTSCSSIHGSLTRLDKSHDLVTPIFLIRGILVINCGTKCKVDMDLGRVDCTVPKKDPDKQVRRGQLYPVGQSLSEWVLWQ